MREILFRGKAIKSKKWIFGDLLQCAGGTQIWEDTEHGKFNAQVFPGTIGEFTGLCDGKNQKIFEGDVIRDEDGDVMVVKWLTESAAFVLEPKPYASIYFYGTLSSRIEVIGNIHDNPELLGRGAGNE